MQWRKQGVSMFQIGSPNFVTPVHLLQLLRNFYDKREGLKVSSFHPEIFLRGGKIRVLKMRWGGARQCAI